jgi:hypothetical protein
MITGWLSGEDCPDCDGPLLDTSHGDQLLILACPGCGYRITWHITDPGPDVPGADDPTDPGETETA